jgi:membrane protein DedA with SNARE-associated domain
MLERFVHWLLHGLLDLGYPGIVALMAMESSILPVPSELVMSPAGYWVAKGEMNAVLVVLSGIAGSILGALANYWVAHTLGRPFVRRFGKYFLVTERSLERSERFFAAHGEISTLIGRMLPVVRHLISIPAGIARMPLPRFITYTGLGALIWCSILTWIGWFLGQHEAALPSAAEIQRYVTRALVFVIPALALLVLGYVWWYRRRAGVHRPPQG